MSKEKIRILLADDQRLITESLSIFLSNYADDIEITGVAENGREVLEMARRERPDIILMDVLMPEMNGIEAVEALKPEYPGIKIIMLSTYADEKYVRASILAGASGYLLKDTSPTELITAIRALRDNIMQISPDIVRRMVEQKFSGEEKPAALKTDTAAIGRSLPWLKTLTNREREIFTLLATGYDNEKIAEKLFVTVQTIKNHISVIYSKLGVKNRFEIIRLANNGN